jgi:hypothetical protein
LSAGPRVMRLVGRSIEHDRDSGAQSHVIEARPPVRRVTAGALGRHTNDEGIDGSVSSHNLPNEALGVIAAHGYPAQVLQQPGGRPAEDGVLAQPRDPEANPAAASNPSSSSRLQVCRPKTMRYLRRLGPPDGRQPRRRSAATARRPNISRTPFRALPARQPRHPARSRDGPPGSSSIGHRLGGADQLHPSVSPYAVPQALRR